MKPFPTGFRTLTGSLTVAVALTCGAASALFGVCGPFTDVAADSFCPFVLEIFTLGITTGTSPTTYDPTTTVNRLQMAAFLSRTVDGTLKRGGRRAALDQFWTPQNEQVLGLTTIGSGPGQVRSDGTDLWVTDNEDSGNVSRIRGSDGRLLETWTGAGAPYAVLVAMGRVFATGAPGNLYRIDPSLPAGAVTTVATNLGPGPIGLAFDGARIWSTNGSGSSVSLVTPAASLPWSVTTVGAGFAFPAGVLFDGVNVWVTDQISGTLLKLDGAASILQTVTVGVAPQYLTFDGSNFWVPNFTSNSVSVVRASSGAVLATLTGNGLNGATEASFDGQRVLVTSNPGNRVSLWKAADLTPLGLFSTGPFTNPMFACSDGINFWGTLSGTGRLARF